ncbi:MAG: hypothetical protein K5761_00955 [Clostridiales bacterium]|nr:hypothetical protein [Clostridiales bacterium]
MSRKITALLLSFSFITLLFSSCSAGKVKVNGTKIDDEIYLYFQDKADKEHSVDLLLLRYVAINSEFEKEGLTLSSSQKASLTAHVDDVWHTYSAHYNKKGISKSTVYKAELSEMYYTILLDNYYGPDGANPVAEEEIKKYFRENYAVIRYVTGYLFNEDENGIVEMTDEQEKTIVNKFNSAANNINEGSTIEEAIVSLGSVDIRDAVVTSSGTSGFPDGFFGKIQKIKTGEASAVTIGSYIFLVLRENGEKGDYECYTDSRTACLEEMKSEEFEKVVSGWTKSYHID